MGEEAAKLPSPAAGALGQTRGQADERLTSGLRVIVSTAGAAIFAIDPSEPEPQRTLAYSVLLAFVIYSLVSHFLVLRRAPRLPIALTPWVDLGWATLLIAVSLGTSSIFFQLYLFATLEASFHGGFRPGMAVVIASVLSFSIVGVLTSGSGPGFELDRSLIRPLYLLVLGYLISNWGGHERRLRARMALLREVTTLSNPRFGVDRTLGRVLGAVRAFCGADTARLVVREADGRGWSRAATAANPEGGDKLELPPEVTAILLPPPPAAALLRREPRWSRRPSPLRSAPDPRGAETVESEELATALDGASFVSVPFRLYPEADARLYLVSRRARAFDHADVELLQHVADQVAPVLENIRLVDRLASDAADEERRRIARDIHDSIIQPYIGLRIGLTAVSDALAKGNSQAAARDLEKLSELAEVEIAGLRRYVRGLASGDGGTSDLLPRAVERFCTRFADATGIRVSVNAALGDLLNDRLSAEVFQMVAEALSNIRKHSDASSARVRIASADGRLRLDIENDGAPAGSSPFTPRSLSDRAAALGGFVEVEHAAGDRTVLRIDVPL